MSPIFDMLSAKYADVQDAHYEYAVLPWGSTEPHNYHLPYLTDCYLAHHISVDATTKAYQQAQIKGMVLPAIPLGSQNPGQHNLLFCLHTRYETQKAILTDIVASLNRQSINKLIIVNGHGGNNFRNMIRDLSLDYPNFVIVVSNWYTILPQAQFFEEKDDHAGEMETSVMMHYCPQLVDLALAGDGTYTPFKSQALNDRVGWMPRCWTKASEDTGIGNPHKSTAAKGQQCAEAVSRKLAELFVEICEGEIYQ